VDKFPEVIKALSENKKGFSGESTLVRKSGETFPALFTTYPVFDDDGKMTATIGVSIDISKRKRAEEKLRALQKIKSVGTLAGGIAHDFNNILMGLFGNISIAKKELFKDHPAFKFLEKAENSMNRATRLTMQLLTFAKGGNPVKEDVSIGALVEETVRFDLSGSNVMPVFNQADDLWMAEVDKGQTQQVFSNLTINANQAMPDGGHLYITLENADISEDVAPNLKQGKYIKATVRDEGTGIDQKYLDQIFDPYFTTKQTGSGLGLATIYSIINKHGGYIAVDSKPGKGTTFTLYLPASESQQLPETKQPAAKRSTMEQTARILVMDDEKMVRKVVTAMLEKSGYSVETADDGKQAIEMYKQSMDAGQPLPFDVVIMDITIPGGMGGKEAIKKILAIDPKARAIVSSGYADDPVMANYAEYGFKGVVSKPYTISKLQEVLGQVLKK
jgi:signal transduction histidine kinase/CheY-like chemotaxis protein